MSASPNEPGDVREEVDSFMRLGIDLEAEIEAAGLLIREQSKLAYE